MTVSTLGITVSTLGITVTTLGNTVTTRGKKKIQNSETRTASGFEGPARAIQNANRLSIDNQLAKAASKGAAAFAKICKASKKTLSFCL